MSNPVTRREFLNLIAASGGTAAVLRMSAVLGLMPTATTAATPQLLHLTDTNRRKIVILGAGLSGLMTAYELGKAGYDCTVLEASHRPGGRIFTVRAGTLIDLNVDPVVAFTEGGAAEVEGHGEDGAIGVREVVRPVEHAIDVGERRRTDDTGAVCDDGAGSGRTIPDVHVEAKPRRDTGATEAGVEVEGDGVEIPSPTADGEVVSAAPV